MADGFRIAAQVFRTKLVVMPLVLVGRTIQGEARWFPSNEPQRQVSQHQRHHDELPCPTCSMMLPATGLCDNCA